MDVDIIKIRKKDYLINFTNLEIELFNPNSKTQKNKYLSNNLNKVNDFNMPEKYNKIYERLVEVKKAKYKLKRTKVNNPKLYK